MCVCVRVCVQVWFYHEQNHGNYRTQPSPGRHPGGLRCRLEGNDPHTHTPEKTRHHPSLFAGPKCNSAQKFSPSAWKVAGYDRSIVVASMGSGWVVPRSHRTIGAMRRHCGSSPLVTHGRVFFSLPTAWEAVTVDGSRSSVALFSFYFVGALVGNYSAR